MKRMKKIAIRTLVALAIIYLILIIVAYLPYETTPISELAGENSKFAEVNGHTIHYIKEGTGKPLILVHGFGGSTYTWRHLIPLLSDHYTVYAYDILGFGLSDKPPDGNYDMKSHGDSLIGFIDALKIPSPSIVGHSMGGIIAGFVGINAPTKVDKLVMIEPGFYTNKTPAFLQYMFFPLNRIMARQFCSRSMQERFLIVSFYDKSLVTEEVVDAYMIPTRTPDILDSMAHMMVSAAAQKYGDVAAKVTKPTLLVWGEREEGVVAEVANRINGEIQGSTLVSVKESGHYIQEEQPQKLAKAIRNFLD